MFQSKKANFAISLILAMILWVYVVGELNPETRKVFRNIPITVMNEQVLANDGLAVVSTSDHLYTNCMPACRDDRTAVI